MSKICKRCKHTMSYDPYFGRNICRQCGYSEMVSKNVKTFNKTSSKNIYLIASASKAVAIK